MTSFASKAGPVVLTGLVTVCAGMLGWNVWGYYMNDPWTRDGKVRADVVSVAADVSGFVTGVEAQDNQAVKKGDVIFRIDQARFDLALRHAQAEVKSAEASLELAKSDLDRYTRLGDGSVTRQKIQQAQTVVAQDEAALDQALIGRDTAKLDLDRSTIRAPVNGKVTNFSLRPGNYVAAGAPIAALIDSDSYYVSGYFEENKIDRVKIGDVAHIYLMGSGQLLRGKVVGIASGIEDRERSDSASTLANVTPTFTWVRLAQRVPVRIALDDVPPDVILVAGRTASVSIEGR